MKIDRMFFEQFEDVIRANDTIAAALERRLTLREILEKVFGLIPRFKSKDELLAEEFAKFLAARVPEPPAAIPPSRPTSRPTPPATGCATSSTAGNSPIWPVSGKKLISY